MKIEEVKKYVEDSLIPLLDDLLLRRKCPSYFVVEVFSIDDYYDEFQKYYLLEKKYLRLDSDISFSELLNFYLFSDDVLRVQKSIVQQLGEIKNIYTISKKAIDQLEKNEVFPFYFIEEVVFLEFSSCCLCFVSGNNE